MVISFILYFSIICTQVCNVPRDLRILPSIFALAEFVHSLAYLAQATAKAWGPNTCMEKWSRDWGGGRTNDGQSTENERRVVCRGAYNAMHSPHVGYSVSLSVAAFGVAKPKKNRLKLEQKSGKNTVAALTSLFLLFEKCTLKGFEGSSSLSHVNQFVVT